MAQAVEKALVLCSSLGHNEHVSVLQKFKECVCFTDRWTDLQLLLLEAFDLASSDLRGGGPICEALLVAALSCFRPPVAVTVADAVLTRGILMLDNASAPIRQASLEALERAAAKCPGFAAAAATVLTVQIGSVLALLDQAGASLIDDPPRSLSAWQKVETYLVALRSLSLGVTHSMSIECSTRSHAQTALHFAHAVVRPAMQARGCIQNQYIREAAYHVTQSIVLLMVRIRSLLSVGPLWENGDLAASTSECLSGCAGVLAAGVIDPHPQARFAANLAVRPFLENFRSEFVSRLASFAPALALNRYLGSERQRYFNQELWKQLILHDDVEALISRAESTVSDGDNVVLDVNELLPLLGEDTGVTSLRSAPAAEPLPVDRDRDTERAASPLRGRSMAAAVTEAHLRDLPSPSSAYSASVAPHAAAGVTAPSRQQVSAAGMGARALEAAVASAAAAQTGGTATSVAAAATVLLPAGWGGPSAGGGAGPSAATTAAAAAAGAAGPRLVAALIAEVVALYRSQLAAAADAEVAEVAEAAANCCAELALKVDPARVLPHVPALLRDLARAVACAADWRPRDVGVVALGRLFVAFAPRATAEAPPASVATAAAASAAAPPSSEIGSEGSHRRTAAAAAAAAVSAAERARALQWGSFERELTRLWLCRAFDRHRMVRDHAAGVLGAVASAAGPGAPRRARLHESMVHAAVARTALLCHAMGLAASSASSASVSDCGDDGCPGGLLPDLPHMCAADDPRALDGALFLVREALALMLPLQLSPSLQSPARSRISLALDAPAGPEPAAPYAASGVAEACATPPAPSAFDFVSAMDSFMANVGLVLASSACPADVQECACRALAEISQRAGKAFVKRHLDAWLALVAGWVQLRGVAAADSGARPRAWAAGDLLGVLRRVVGPSIFRGRLTADQAAAIAGSEAVPRELSGL